MWVSFLGFWFNDTDQINTIGKAFFVIYKVRTILNNTVTVFIKLTDLHQSEFFQSKLEEVHAKSF